MSNPIRPQTISRKARSAAVAFALVACFAAGSARATPEVQALLKKADAFRLVDGASQVDTGIESFRGERLDKERTYLVLLGDGRKSLVISRTAIEKGQKILMIGDDFWLLLPQSQRPIRITPAQKLLGEASTGDIATMTWSDDYDGGVVGDEPAEGVPCTHLSLTAQRKGVTYTRIELFLAKADGRPVRADLFLASEKMAKRATFAVGPVGGRQQVTAMTLADFIQPDRRTVIKYLSRAPHSTPGEWFHPMFLARGELPE